MNRYEAYKEAFSRLLITPLEARWLEGLWPSDPNPMPRFRLWRWLP